MKFGSLDKMKITCLEPEDYLVRSEKGLITSLGLKTIVRSKKKKKASYAITNVIMNNISKFIREFEKFPYKGCVRNRPKHEPIDSYFYLSIQLSKCMMRSDAFNFHVDPVRTKITGT